MSGTETEELLQFVLEWKSAFGETPPLGHALRVAYPEHWTRFHALPKGKRYPESESEVRIVLDRANELIAACFDGMGGVWVALPRYEGASAKAGATMQRLKTAKAFQFVDTTVEPEDQVEISIYAAKTRWQERHLDWLLVKIAEDQERAILFDSDCGTVFAPYDGGFDIVSLRAEKITTMEKVFFEWMSDRPDKL